MKTSTFAPRTRYYNIDLLERRIGGKTTLCHARPRTRDYVLDPLRSRRTAAHEGKRAICVGQQDRYWPHHVTLLNARIEYASAVGVFPRCRYCTRDREWYAPRAMILLHTDNDFFGLSDEGMEDVIYDSWAILSFVGIDLNGELTPHAFTLLRWSPPGS